MADCQAKGEIVWLSNMDDMANSLLFPDNVSFYRDESLDGHSHSNGSPNLYATKEGSLPSIDVIIDEDDDFLSDLPNTLLPTYKKVAQTNLSVGFDNLSYMSTTGKRESPSNMDVVMLPVNYKSPLNSLAEYAADPESYYLPVDTESPIYLPKEPEITDKDFVGENLVENYYIQVDPDSPRNSPWSHFYESLPEGFVLNTSDGLRED